MYKCNVGWNDMYDGTARELGSEMATDRYVYLLYILSIASVLVNWIQADNQINVSEDYTLFE